MGSNKRYENMPQLWAPIWIPQTRFIPP